jgi:hypothetical protein
MSDHRDVDVERARRIGLNESVFRGVNEQLEALADRFGRPEEGLDLICECGDMSCEERLVLTRPEYERLRADPVLFAVVPGHVSPGVEDVVRQGNGYEVVRKRPGVPSDVARSTDPRHAGP